MVRNPWEAFPDRGPGNGAPGPSAGLLTWRGRVRQLLGNLAEMVPGGRAEALQGAHPGGVFPVQFHRDPVLGILGAEVTRGDGLPDQFAIEEWMPDLQGHPAESGPVGGQGIGQAGSPFGVAAAPGLDRGDHFGRDAAGLGNLALGLAQFLAATPDKVGRSISRGVSY